MKNAKTPQVKKFIFQTVVPESVSMPLGDFLKQTAPLSGRSLRKYFFKGLVLLNNRRAHSAAMVKSGDSVIVFEDTVENPALKAENIPLDIVYEDYDLLVLNKPAGLVVHPVRNILTGTLVNGVAAYFKEIGLHAKVRPVNRLDSGTSGLIIFAKNVLTQDSLSKAILKHQISRIYFAIVSGIPGSDSGIITAPIGENKDRRFVTKHGRPAETHFKIVERFRDACMLELNLKTGRTHQIRAHLSYIGFPILGDPKYGVASQLINRPALHAGKINFSASSFPIPELTAPFPADFRELLERIRLR